MAAETLRCLLQPPSLRSWPRKSCKSSPVDIRQVRFKYVKPPMGEHILVDPMLSLDRFLVEGSLQLLFYEEGLLPLELKAFMSLAQMPGRKPRLSQVALLEMSGYPERPQDAQPDPAKWQNA